ncbi:MAG: hypothetical protein N2V75_01285 [Methanophagales archaeon]|nr:hypothetical protein [Methanophagales archaeon]
MKKTPARLILIRVVVIALAMSFTFGGVAFASRNVPPTPETATLTITTEVVCDRKMKEIEQLNWECSNKDLLDNPPLTSGQKYGKIKYKENTFSSGGTINLYKDFKVDTGKTPNLEVTKNIGYTAACKKGSVSHTEGVGMSLKSKGCCVYVAAGCYMSMTDVQATTETKAQITQTPEMHYEINAGRLEGPGNPAEGLISASMSASVDDEHKGLKLRYKTTVDGSFAFYEVMDFKP